MTQWRRWRRIFGPHPGQEVDEELQFHLEQRTREYAAKGMSPESARRLATEKFGDVARVRKTCMSLFAADRAAQERRTFVSVSWLDMKLGLRSRRKPCGRSKAYAGNPQGSARVYIDGARQQDPERLSVRLNRGTNGTIAGLVRRRAGGRLLADGTRPSECFADLVRHFDESAGQRERSIRRVHGSANKARMSKEGHRQIRAVVCGVRLPRRASMRPMLTSVAGSDEPPRFRSGRSSVR